jgi:hypothetical protein
MVKCGDERESPCGLVIIIIAKETPLFYYSTKLASERIIADSRGDQKMSETYHKAGRLFE